VANRFVIVGLALVSAVANDFLRRREILYRPAFKKFWPGARRNCCGCIRRGIL